MYQIVDLRGTTNCFNRTWRWGGGRRLDLLEMVWNESTGQWFLDGSRFAVISKRLISLTLVKTIRFSRLKITRSLIVSSNERLVLGVTLLCVYASSSTCSPLLFVLPTKFLILLKKKKEKTGHHVQKGEVLSNIRSDGREKMCEMYI